MIEDRLLNAQHVAELLDMSRKAVYTAAERGEIPYVRIGRRRIRFQHSAIARLMRDGSVPRGRVSAPTK